MAIKRETLIQFTITEDSIILWQGIIRKLLDMPRIGFNQRFTPDEWAMIYQISDFRNVEKGKDVQIMADHNTIVNQAEYGY